MGVAFLVFISNPSLLSYLIWIVTYILYGHRGLLIYSNSAAFMNNPFQGTWHSSENLSDL